MKKKIIILIIFMILFYLFYYSYIQQKIKSQQFEELQNKSTSEKMIN